MNQAVKWICEHHNPAQSLVSWSAHLGKMAEPFSDGQEKTCTEYKTGIQSSWPCPVVFSLKSKAQFPVKYFGNFPKVCLQH